MNNPRLLTGLLAAVLWGGMSAHAQSERVYTLEDIFRTAESNSSRLKPSLTAEMAAQRDIETAKAARLPEISASLSLGFNGNGFTTARDFSDYQKAPIPHLNNGVGVAVTQPVYAGGAITANIELETLKSTAALLGTEHVVESTYAEAILGLDTTNLIDLNWYVLAGIVAGAGLTYWLFCMRRWRYKSMVAISFVCLAAYLCWFYFLIDYNVEKEMLFTPLFLRGIASVMISIVLLTSIVQSGLPFMVFPQALVINGFMGAVCGAALGPAVIGELFSRITARNFALISSGVTDTAMARQFPADSVLAHLGDVFGMTQLQAMLVSMKELYGLLLIFCIICIVIISLSYSRMRPWAIFPKWRTIRRFLRRESRNAQEISA